jgi:hypothetical protein
MNSVFLPIPPPEATEAINSVMDEAVGFELIAIPALGGCVVAIKEIAREGSQVLSWLHSSTRKDEERRILAALESIFLPDDAA